MSSTNFESVGVGMALGGARTELKSVKVTVTPAQVLASNATPVTLVAAPGSSKVLEFVSAIVHKPAGTAYAGIAAGEDLAIKYTDASGAQVNTSLETTGFLDQTTAQTRLTRQIGTEYTPVANAPLVAHLLVGEITTGNSPLYLTVHYRVYSAIDSAI